MKTKHEVLISTQSVRLILRPITGIIIICLPLGFASMPEVEESENGTQSIHRLRRSEPESGAGSPASSGSSGGLDSTSLLSMIMALIVLCVIWESITSLMCGAPFWEKWENTKYPERTHDNTLGNGSSLDDERREKNICA